MCSSVVDLICLMQEEVCASALTRPQRHCYFLRELRVQRNPDGPRLAVVTRGDSCFCVCQFRLLQLQSNTNRPDCPMEHWSWTTLALVPLSGPHYRKQLMTARWLAAGPALRSASPIPLYLLFFPSASLSVRNMFPVV